MNYVPLAISAHSLSRPGALEAELAGADLPRELRQAGVRQLWIVVPLVWWWPQWRKVGAAMVGLVGRRDVEQARYDEALGHRPRSVRPG